MKQSYKNVFLVKYFEIIIMINRLFLLVSLLILSVANVWAARIQGTVTDDKGVALPYATVIILNSNQGTSTDDQGYYYMDLPQGSYQLQAYYMGYETKTQQVEVRLADQTIDFKLNPTHISISQVEIVSKDEDPAYEIMRLANERKKQRVQDIKSFESDVYLKGRLDILESPSKFMGVDIKEAYEEIGLDKEGSGIVYALEQKSHYKYDQHKSHHYIEYVRQSGDPQGLGLSDLPPVLDIYENRIIVLGLNPRGFISPLHNQATNFYRFEYMGEIRDAGQTILKVKLIPRRTHEPVFQGYVYVFDKTYDIHSVELKLDRTSEIDIAEKVNVDQMFRYIDEQRVIQRQNIYIQIDLLGFKVGGDFITMYSQQKVNKPIEWGKNETSKIVATYDSKYATKQTEEAWEEIRPIRMNDKEVKFFEVQDSLVHERQTKEETVAGLDLGIMDLFTGGRIYEGEKWDLRFNGLLSTLNFNTVEGLNINLNLEAKFDIDSLAILRAGMNHRYGFVNGHYNPSAYVFWDQKSTENTGRNYSIGLSGGKEVEAFNEKGFLPPIFNTVTSLLQGINHLKLVEKDFIKASYKFRSGTGWSGYAHLGYQKYNQLWNSTLYSFSENPDTRYTSNQPTEILAPFHERSLVFNASLKYQPGWKYISFTEYQTPISSAYPVFGIEYSKGVAIKDFADARYDLLSLNVSQNVGLKMLGVLSYAASWHGFLSSNNKVPWSEWKHFRSNEFILHKPQTNSFFMKPYYLMSHDQGSSVELHGEWQWKGFITNKIPLFKQLNWQGVIGGHALFQGDQQYAEMTFGLNNIGFKLYRFLRVDGVVAWENNSKPIYGIRVSLDSGLFNVEVN